MEEETKKKSISLERVGAAFEKKGPTGSSNDVILDVVLRFLGDATSSKEVTVAERWWWRGETISSDVSVASVATPPSPALRIERGVATLLVGVFAGTGGGAVSKWLCPKSSK